MRYFCLVVLLAAVFSPKNLVLAKPSCEMLRGNWNSHYHRDFGIDWPKDSFSCNSKQEKLAEAIYHLHAPYFSDNPEFYKKASRLVSRTIYAQGDPHCTNFLAGGRRSDWTILLCDSFFESEPEYRAAGILHESRHLEGSDPAHTTCLKGPDKGKQGACDEYFDLNERGGAYVKNVVYWSSVLKARSHELNSWYLKAFINHQVPDRFNIISAEDTRAWRQ